MKRRLTTCLLALSVMTPFSVNAETLEWIDDVPRPENNVYTVCNAYSNIDINSSDAFKIDDLGNLLYISGGFRSPEISELVINDRESISLENVIASCNYTREEIKNFDFMDLSSSETYRNFFLKENDRYCAFNIAYTYHIYGDSSYLNEIEKYLPHCKAIRNSIQNKNILNRMVDTFLKKSCDEWLDRQECEESKNNIFNYGSKEIFVKLNGYFPCVYDSLSMRSHENNLIDLTSLLRAEFEDMFDITLECQTYGLDF